MKNSRILLSMLLLFCLVSISGCRSMWNRVRENERQFAASSARSYSDTGNCPDALQAFDRANAKIDIGPFGKETIQARIRCYEKAGRSAAARAHVRLLDDFYSKKNPSYPAEDGSSVFRVSDIGSEPFEAPPSALKIASPQYSDFARRSRIIGRVVVRFKLNSKNEPTNIRVLEMPHPLLATWSIEAIERSRKSKRARDAVIVPGGNYIATFSFQYRWAEPITTTQLDVVSGDTSGNTPETTSSEP